MKRYNWLCLSLMLVACSVHSASKGHSTIKLAGNLAALVSWAPVQSRHSYQEQLPKTDKIAEFEKLGYGVATLTERHEIMLRNDKTIEETVTNSQLYITSNGIANAGNSGFWIDANNQRVEIQEAYVLQPDGALVNVEPETLQINSDNTYNIFNDLYYVTVPFPHLKSGSVSVLVYKTISDRKKWPLPWSRTLFTGNFNHIESFQVQVDWADDRLKPAWQSDYAKLECKESARSLHCSSKVANPPMPMESDMPSVYDLLPVLVIAEPTSWAAISNTVQTLTEPALSSDGKIKDLAGQLAKDANLPEVKMSRLLAFVTREIRYVGIEHGRGGVVPKSTLTTLADRYGDCKDKTMLFVDLARQAGLDAYPVLTSTSRKSLSKLLLPASSYFNHMIACVKLNPEKESCVDLTDPEASAEYLPQSIQGAVSLAIGRGTVAPGKLDTELYTWRVLVKVINRFTEDGAVIETLERNYYTHWAAALRNALASKSKADQDRWLLEVYRAVVNDKANPTFQLEGLDQSKLLLVITSNTEYRNVFNPSIFTSYNEIDPWLMDIVKDTRTLNTHYPLSFKGLIYESQLTYKMSPGEVINNLGPKMDYVTPWGKFHRYYREEEGAITVFTELRMPRADIPVAEIPQFNRFLELTARETRIWFEVENKLE